MIIDKTSKDPLYLQLYENLKNRIVVGEYKIGDKLPSKRNLADSLSVSLNTVTKAYFLLEEEGFISAKERSGYYVELIENSVLLPKEENVLLSKKNVEVDMKYDFSSSSIAYKDFPYYTFSKLYKEAFSAESENLLKGSEIQGKYEFRLAISKYLKNARGLDSNPDNIFISSGMEYLFEILFYIFNKNSIFAIENPGYSIIPNMIESRGFKSESISVGVDGMNINDLEKSKANLVTISPSHQFPTGTIMPISNRMEILKWAVRSEKRFIIEDDYDSEFKYVGKPIDPLKSLDRFDKVIYMGSFSKSIAPSMRISYMILPIKLMKILVRDAPFFICSVPVVDQWVMSEFLNRGHFERHLNKMRRIYKKTREALILELEKYKEVLEIKGADAGLHIVVNLKTNKSDQEVINSCKEKGIRLQSVSEFYNSGNIKSGEFILGFGSLKKEDIKPGIKGIIQSLK